MKNSKPLVLLLSFLMVFFVSIQHAGVFQAYTHNTLTHQVDELFKKWDRNDSPGAALGIFKDGRIIYARGYGMANLEYSLVWTPQTPSRVGSISKQFIAMCIAILIEDRKLSLEDDIRKFIPGWPDYGMPVKIKHLLHHTSGIREYLDLVELIGKPEGSGYVYTPNELVKTLSRQKELNFKPGKMFSYSNSGYFLLSEIIEKVSGMKTSAFAKKYIFDPLEMNNTHFHDNPDKIVKNRAYGYSPKKNGGYELDILRLKVIGDLGVFTTIEDFLKWDRNFYDNKLGNGTQDLIKKMTSRGQLNNGKKIPYALGLNIDDYRGLRTRSHGGSAVGYQAYFLQFPDYKFSIVILSNLSTFHPGRIARKIADLYLADQFTEPPTPRPRERSREEKPEPISLPLSRLKKYVGKYYSDELEFAYSFSVKNNNLILKIRETSHTLTPVAPDKFSWGRHRMDFIRNKENEITGFVLQSDIIKNMRFQKINEH